jgi:hypothetical protein
VLGSEIVLVNQRNQYDPVPLRGLPKFHREVAAVIFQLVHAVRVGVAAGRTPTEERGKLRRSF